MKKNLNDDQTYKPGEIAPKDGEYKTPNEPSKTVDKGERIPPTKKPGKTYKILPKKPKNK